MGFMSDCKLLIDRLKNGQTEKIDQKLAGAFLGPDEEELKFSFPVKVKGEAYLTDDHLIVHLKAETRVLMPCSICNQMIDSDLKVDHFYQAVPVEEIPSAIYDYQDLLREALLLELPRTVECNSGKCPERETMAPYMRHVEDTNFPFADIEKEES